MCSARSNPHALSQSPAGSHTQPHVHAHSRTFKSKHIYQFTLTHPHSLSLTHVCTLHAHTSSQIHALSHAFVLPISHTHIYLHLLLLTHTQFYAPMHTAYLYTNVKHTQAHTVMHLHGTETPSPVISMITSQGWTHPSRSHFSSPSPNLITRQNPSKPSTDLLPRGRLPAACQPAGDAPSSLGPCEVNSTYLCSCPAATFDEHLLC